MKRQAKEVVPVLMKGDNVGRNALEVGYSLELGLVPSLALENLSTCHRPKYK